MNNVVAVMRYSLEVILTLIYVWRHISVKITPTASIMRPTAFIMRSIQRYDEDCYSK